MKKLREPDAVYKPRPLCYWCEGTGKEIVPSKAGFRSHDLVTCTVCGGIGTR